MIKILPRRQAGNFKGKGRVKALNKWKNYFLKNKDRMQYSQFKTKRLPQGSGSVESAIRRVINLRLKSCGSFWKKENAEIYLFLRSQLISGRWNVFFENLIKRLDYDEYQANIKSNSYLKWAAWLYPCFGIEPVELSQDFTQ